MASQIKLKQWPGFGGSFVDSEYLGRAYDAGKPHVFEGIMAKVYQARNRFTALPLTAMTKTANMVKTIPTEVYRWYLQGAETKMLRQVENLEAANATPGIGLSTFKIKLDEDWVSSPEVLFPENNEYPLAIVSGPIVDGNGFIYEVRIQTEDPSVYLPATYLEVGKEFTKVWTTVAAERNKEFGGSYYESSYMLESQVSAFAQELTVTDKALREDGRLGIQVINNGKTYNRFIPVAEMKMEEELSTSKEAQALHGKRSVTKEEKTGSYWKRTGPGLREQLKDGFTQAYGTALTEDFIKEYLLDIFFARNDEGNRMTTAMTGQEGSIQFHDLLAAKARAFLTVDTNYVKQADKPRHLSYGAQFTHYFGPEGVTLDLIKNPMYDDRRYCLRTIPGKSNRPIDSRRLTFVDFASPKSTDWGSNVMMLEVENSLSYGFITGTVGPMGPIKGGATTMKEAAYTRWRQETGGICVIDTSRTGELIYDIDE